MQNLQTPNPATFQDRMAAVEAGLAAINQNLVGPKNNVTTSDLTLTALAAPSGTAVANVGTAGSTGYTYVVADVGNVGVAPAAGVATTTGNATLTAAAYNQITWVTIPGHTYNIYRSVSSGTPSSTGLIGTVTAGAGVFAGSFNDTGITATGTVPTANTTGSITVPGPVFGTGSMLVGSTPQTISTSASTITLTPANILNQVLTIQGGTTPTVTLPSSAVLVAALPGVPVNTGFEVAVRNRGGGTLTLAVGSGGVTDSGNTLTTVSSHMKRCFVQITNVTPASEAYTLYTLSDSAI